MKIYTKGGDQGETSLFGGSRLSKANIKIAAYGNVDELNSYLGLVRDLTKEKDTSETLTDIQRVLFTIGSHLAADPSKENLWLPPLEEKEIQNLEILIDKIQDMLAPLTHFILPGGSPLISHCHIARCICRRTERRVVELSEVGKVDAFIIKYLNRLSDYLFVLSRYVAHQNDVEEIKWESGR